MEILLAEIDTKGLVKFEGNVDLTGITKERSAEVLDLSPVKFEGLVRKDGLIYALDAQLDYEITLPSSRSLTPVRRNTTLDISENYVKSSDRQASSEFSQNEELLFLEEEFLDLDEVFVQNILLAIPSKVLTEEEEKSDKLPSGNAWQVLTEEEFEAQKEARKKENSPFAGLNKILENEEK